MGFADSLKDQLKSSLPSLLVAYGGLCFFDPLLFKFLSTFSESPYTISYLFQFFTGSFHLLPILCFIGYIYYIHEETSRLTWNRKFGIRAIFLLWLCFIILLSLSFIAFWQLDYTMIVSLITILMLVLIGATTAIVFVWRSRMDRTTNFLVVTYIIGIILCFLFFVRIEKKFRNVDTEQIVDLFKGHIDYRNIKTVSEQCSPNLESIKLNQLIIEVQNLKSSNKKDCKNQPVELIELAFFDPENKLSKEKDELNMQSNFKVINEYISKRSLACVDLKSSKQNAELIRLYALNLTSFIAMTEGSIVKNSVGILEQIRLRSLVLITAALSLFVFLLILSILSENGFLQASLKILISLYLLILLQHFKKTDESSVDVNDPGMAFTHFNWYLPNFFNATFINTSIDEKNYYTNQSLGSEVLQEQQQAILKRLNDLEASIAVLQNTAESVKVDYTIVEKSKRDKLFTDLDKIRKKIDVIDTNTRRR